jgi:magnesium transporter
VLTAFAPSGRLLLDPTSAACPAALREAAWIDLLNPSPEEARIVESTLSLQLPTRREAQEIEISSRLYAENGTVFMTATVMVGTDTPHPSTTAVTFAYQPTRLVTLRFAEPTPFTTFAAKAQRIPGAPRRRSSACSTKSSTASPTSWS